MCERVIVGEEEEGSLDLWEILYSLAQGWTEGLRQQQLPPTLMAQKKGGVVVGGGSLGTAGLQATQPATGRECIIPRGLHNPPRSSSPCLPSAVCSARQKNTKAPNHPGLTAFTCDPLLTRKQGGDTTVY